jgi:hypothetical protein
MSSARPSAVEERLARWAQNNPASPVGAVVDHAVQLGYVVLAPEGDAKYLRLVLDAPAGRGATLYVDNFGLTAASASTRELTAAMPGAVVRARDVRLPFDATDPMAVLDSFRRGVTGGPAGPPPAVPMQATVQYPTPQQATVQYPVPPAGASAVGTTRRPSTRLAVIAAVVLVLVVFGAVGSGFGGAMSVLGLAVLVVGVLAAVRGGAHWAHIASRRVGGIVAAVGLVALMIGGATLPAEAPVTTVAAPPPSALVAAPALDTEAATMAAEAQLLVAETEEATPAAASDLATGLLGDTAAQTAVETAQPTTALAALAAVPVKGRAPKTGYSRDQFGAAWTDVDRNGCDTRNDVLARDLTAEAFKPGTRDCVVVSGQLADPYSGTAINFVRGQDTSAAVQIDHVVALSNAWQTGAQALDAAKRTALANDPLNLLAVDGPLNMQKGDGDAATWLPPNKGYRCAYVARQVAVKVSYGLWTTQAEHNAMATVLASCPAEPLPGGVVANVPVRTTAAPALAPAPAPVAKPTPAPAPKTSAQPVPKPAPAPAPAPVVAPVPTVEPEPETAPEPEPETESTDVYYANCDAVRADGAAPIHAGDPGWQSKFDRDKDGVGCE